MDGFTACQRVLPCRWSIIRNGYLALSFYLALPSQQRLHLRHSLKSAAEVSIQCFDTRLRYEAHRQKPVCPGYHTAFARFL